MSITLREACRIPSFLVIGSGIFLDFGYMDHPNSEQKIFRIASGVAGKELLQLLRTLVPVPFLKTIGVIKIKHNCMKTFNSQL